MFEFDPQRVRGGFRLLLAGAAITLVTFGVGSEPASAKTGSVANLKPTRVEGRSLVFRLPKIQASRIHSSLLVVGRSARKPVPARKLRRALRTRQRTVRIRPPRLARVASAARSRKRSVWRNLSTEARLVLFLRRSGTRRKSRPAPTPTPSTESPSTCSTCPAPVPTTSTSGATTSGSGTGSGTTSGSSSTSGSQPSPTDSTTSGAGSSSGSTSSASVGCSPTVSPSWTFGWGTFDVGNWPSACWRPYGASSPFNQTFAELQAQGRVRPLSNSSQIVGQLMDWGGPIGMNTGDWQHPIYFSRPTDPVFTIHCTEQWGTCDVEGAQVRIPAQARPAGGTDKHLAVIDQQTGWEYDFWNVQKDGPVGQGGVLNISWGGKTRIDGNGLGTNATAAHFGLAAGIVRGEELKAGRIEHALFLAVRCTNGSSVWPSAPNGTGAPCSSTYRGSAPPMGALVRLEMTDAQIDALPVPAWKKPILKALARYGSYIGDTTGNPAMWWQFQAGESYTSFGYEDPVARFARDNQAQGGISYDPTYDDWHFDIKSGVDWRQYLRVYQVAPPS